MNLSEYIPPLLLDEKTVNAFANLRGSWTGYSARSETNICTLILVPSEVCNLHCKYCYETIKEKTKMPLSLAKQLIQEYFDALPPDNILKIEFRGGEPLLEFDWIKEICEWTLEHYKTDNYFFYAVTNGTCLTEESKSWLVQHKNIITMPLSLDGSKETHDANRSNSFDFIDLDFFQTTWKNAYTYMTIIPENSSRISENLLFLIQKECTIRANFEFSQIWRDSDIITCAIQLRNAADTVLETGVRHRLNLLSCYGFIDFEEQPNEDRRFILNCNAGCKRFLYTPDGKKYPCHTLVPSSFNHFGKDNDTLFETLRHEVINPPECCHCSYFYLCYICVGFSMSYAGDYTWRNPSFCEITRVRTFTAAYYWGKRLYKKTRTASLTLEEKYLANKIYTFYKAEKYV